MGIKHIHKNLPSHNSSTVNNIVRNVTKFTRIRQINYSIDYTRYNYTTLSFNPFQIYREVLGPWVTHKSSVLRPCSIRPLNIVLLSGLRVNIVLKPKYNSIGPMRAIKSWVIFVALPFPCLPVLYNHTSRLIIPHVYD